MPRLCAIRFDCVGHRDAYLDGVVLPLATPAGAPVDSLLWLRNGGGKSSILTLVFSVLRPNRREFLGRDAELRARSLEDYVADDDTAVVTLEWELDAPRGQKAPHVLTGIIMEWVQRPDRKELRRMWFSLQLDEKVAVTIDSLPFKADEGGRRIALRLSAIREALKEVASSSPGSLAFEESQNAWEALLGSFHIDPEVFGYQLKMNRREGGAEELFRFSTAGQFVDFIIDMVLPVDDAQAAARNLERLRENVRRRPALVDERDALERIAPPLATLSELATQRDEVLGSLVRSVRGLCQLRARLRTNQAQLEEEVAALRHEHALQDARYRTSSSRRVQAGQAARSYRNRGRLKAHEDAERRLEASAATRNAATARRDTFALAVRWDEEVVRIRAQAEALRAELERQQSEHRPLLVCWQSAAATLCNSLLVATARLDEQRARIDEDEGRLLALQREVSASLRESNERVARWRAELETATQTVKRIDEQRAGLEAEGALLAGETGRAALKRLDDELVRIQADLDAMAARLAALRQVRRETEAELRKVAQEVAVAEREALHAMQAVDDARRDWDALADDPNLAALLQDGKPSLPEMAGVIRGRLAASQRTIDDRVVTIETERSLHARAAKYLENNGLLPPSVDAERVRDALRHEGIPAHPGLEYLQANAAKDAIPSLIAAHPALAGGVVVPDSKLESARKVLASVVLAPDVPVAVGTTKRLMADGDAECVVLPRPASYDKDAAAAEQSALDARRVRWDEEVARLHDERRIVAELLGRLDVLQRDRHAEWMGRARSEATQRRERADALVERARSLESAMDSNQAATHQTQELQTSAQRQQRVVDKHRANVNAFTAHGGDDAGRLRESCARLSADIAHEEERRRLLDVQREQMDTQMRAVQERRIAWTKERTPIDAELAEVQVLRGDEEGEAGVDMAVARTRFRTAQLEYEKVASDSRLRGQLDELERRAVEGEQSVRRGCAQSRVELSAVIAACDEARIDGRIGELAGAARHAAEQAEESWRRDSVEEQTLARVRREAEEDQRVHRQQHPSAAERFWLECEGFDAGLCAEKAREEDRKADEERAVEVDADARRKVAAESIDGKTRSLDQIAQWMKRDEAALASAAGIPETEAELMKPPEPALSTTVDPETELSGLVTLFTRDQQRLLSVREEADTQRNALSRLVMHPTQSSLPEGLRIAASEPNLPVLLGRVAQLALDVGLRRDIINAQLVSIDEDRALLARQLNSVADPALHALHALENHSRLPPHIPVWGGEAFIKVTARAPKSAKEREAVAAALVDRIVDEESVPSGLVLVQRIVRELTQQNLDVKILKPEVFRRVEHRPVEQMASFSGGEKLTAAILLYCTLARMRSKNRGRMTVPTGVLFLDNPIGTCSKPEFVSLQVDMARALGVQLVYTTGVEDLQAVAWLPNRVRILNEHKDVRGRMRVRVESRDIDVARIVRLDGEPA